MNQGRRLGIIGYSQTKFFSTIYSVVSEGVYCSLLLLLKQELTITIKIILFILLVLYIVI